MGGKVVYLVRLDLLDDPDEVRRVGEVPVMHEETHAFLMRVLIEMIHTRRIE